MVLRNITSALSSHFDHPILGILLTTAGILTIIGIIIDYIIVNTSLPYIGDMPGIIPGFFAVYAVLTGFLALLGYAILFIVKYASILRDRAAPNANSPGL